jgi:hypothetical protein
MRRHEQSIAVFILYFVKERKGKGYVERTQAGFVLHGHFGESGIIACVSQGCQLITGKGELKVKDLPILTWKRDPRRLLCFDAKFCNLRGIS